MRFCALTKRNRPLKAVFLCLPIAPTFSLPYVQATKHLAVGRLKIKELPKGGMHSPVARLPLLPHAASGIEQGTGSGLRQLSLFPCCADLLGRGIAGRIVPAAVGMISHYERASCHSVK